MACIHCGFTYFMTPCFVCNTNYYCHYCTNILKSCHSCSQIACNNCKTSNLVKCSNCNNKLCIDCINKYVNNIYNSKCIDCILFDDAIENENKKIEDDV